MPWYNEVWNLGNEETIKHYIVIEVRENLDREYGTDAGDIRGTIHKFIKDRGINAADMIFHEDRTRLYNGSPNPYPEIKSIFEAVMESFKEFTRRNHATR